MKSPSSSPAYPNGANSNCSRSNSSSSDPVGIGFPRADTSLTLASSLLGLNPYFDGVSSQVHNEDDFLYHILEVASAIADDCVAMMEQEAECELLLIQTPSSKSQSYKPREYPPTEPEQ
jgi:hypothetical protein